VIERSNRDIGYLDEEVHTTFSFTQTVKAGNTVYFSGVAPLRGSLADLQIVGENDIRAQLEWCLEILRRCLDEQKATFHHLVAQTVYTLDIDELAKHADVFATAFAGEAPAATWLQVERLFHPAQLVEITGIAVLDQEMSQDHGQ